MIINEDTTILGQTDKQTQIKPKFKIVKQHVQGAVAMLLVFVFAVSALIVTPGVNLFGALNNEETVAVQSGSALRHPRIDSASDMLEKLPERPSLFEVNTKNVRETSQDDLTNLASHVQGYSRYRPIGSDTDYHILNSSATMHSNGSIYFFSQERNSDGFPEYDYSFRLSYKDSNGKDAKYNGEYYNHPAGMQIIGDYLVVSNATESSSYSMTYLFNLEPLTRNEKPEIKEIENLRHTVGGVAGTGISDVCGTLVGYDTGTTAYVIGIFSDGRGLRLYASEPASTPFEAVWSSTKHHEFLSDDFKEVRGGGTYQGSVLFPDESGELFLMGFRSAGDYSDFIDLFKLTENGGKTWLETAKHEKTKEVHKKDGYVKGAFGVHFRWGSTIEIRSDTEAYIYATSRDFVSTHLIGSNPKHVDINIYKYQTDQPIDDGWYEIESVKKDLFLRLEGGKSSNKTNLELSATHNDNYSKFKFEHYENGFYKIKSMANENKVIEVADFNRDDGTSIRIYEWDDNIDNKLWELDVRSDGSYLIRNKYTQKVMDIKDGKLEDGQKVHQWSAHGRSSQKFELVPVTPGELTVEDGWYEIKTASGDFYLRLENNRLDNKTNLKISATHDDNYSKFYIRHINHGYYKIESAGNQDKVIEVADKSRDNGASIRIYEWQEHEPDNKLWEIKPQDNGNYIFINKYSQKVMDIKDGKVEEGSKVHQWSRHDDKRTNDSQHFTLIPTTQSEAVIPDGLYHIETSANSYFARLYNGNTNNKTNIVLADPSWKGDESTKFHFEHMGDGYYRIQTASDTSKYIEVADHERKDGASIRIFEWDDRPDNKLWEVKVISTADGRVKVNLINKHSQKAMDIKDRKYADGTRVHQWTFHGGATQEWYLIPIDPREGSEGIDELLLMVEELTTQVIKSIEALIAGGEKTNPMFFGEMRALIDEAQRHLDMAKERATDADVESIQKMEQMIKEAQDVFDLALEMFVDPIEPIDPEEDYIKPEEENIIPDGSDPEPDDNSIE